MHERKGINYIEANQLTITKILYHFFMLETAELNLKFEFESAMSLISIVYLTVCMHSRIHWDYNLAGRAQVLEGLKQKSESAKMHMQITRKLLNFYKRCFLASPESA